MESRPDPPDIAEIICNPDGSTTLLTPEIRTQPDGVHAWVINRRDVSAYPSPAFRPAYVPTGAIATTPPGEWVVACWNHGEGLDAEQRRAQTLTIRDVGGYWTPTKFDCRPGETRGSWGNLNLTPEGEPREMTEGELLARARREWDSADERQADAFVRGGYSDQSEPRFKVVRGSRVVGGIAFERIEGHLVVGGGSSCVGAP